MTHPLKPDLGIESTMHEAHHHNVPIVNVIDKDREALELEPHRNIEETAALNIEFDEADALFGKRTGTKDSHGRY